MSVDSLKVEMQVNKLKEPFNLVFWGEKILILWMQCPIMFKCTICKIVNFKEILDKGEQSSIIK